MRRLQEAPVLLKGKKEAIRWIIVIAQFRFFVIWRDGLRHCVPWERGQEVTA